MPASLIEIHYAPENPLGGQWVGACWDNWTKDSGEKSVPSTEPKNSFSFKAYCNRKPWVKSQAPCVLVLYSTTPVSPSCTVKSRVHSIPAALTHICQHLHYKLLLNFHWVWFSTSTCHTHTPHSQTHRVHLTGTISLFNPLPRHLVKTSLQPGHAAKDLILLFPLPLGPRTLPFLPGLAASSKVTKLAGANTE